VLGGLDDMVKSFAAKLRPFRVKWGERVAAELWHFDMARARAIA